MFVEAQRLAMHDESPGNLHGGGESLRRLVIFCEPRRSGLSSSSALTGTRGRSRRILQSRAETRDGLTICDSASTRPKTSPRLVANRRRSSSCAPSIARGIVFEIRPAPPFRSFALFIWRRVLSGRGQGTCVRIDRGLYAFAGRICARRRFSEAVELLAVRNADAAHWFARAVVSVQRFSRSDRSDLRRAFQPASAFRRPALLDDCFRRVGAEALAQCDRFRLAVADTFCACSDFRSSLTRQRDDLYSIFQ